MCLTCLLCPPCTYILLMAPADLPASLLQKFHAAAGNHSKKPWAYITRFSWQKHLLISFVNGHPVHPQSYRPRFEMLKEFLLADEMSLGKKNYSLSICPKVLTGNAWYRLGTWLRVYCRRDVKLDASIKQPLGIKGLESWKTIVFENDDIRKWIYHTLLREGASTEAPTSLIYSVKF